MKGYYPLRITTRETPMEALERVIAFTGGVNKLARLLNISHPNICQWRRNGKVPPKQAFRIAKATNYIVRPEELFEEKP